MEEVLVNTITKEEIEKLEGFIGYGREDAEVIFFGLEEAGGGFENLRIRLEIEEYKYLDCKRFHIDHLKYTKSHSDDINKKVKFQPVWRYMSYIMLRLEGYTKEELIADKSLLRDYQNNSLGTTALNGKTLLTEIYPIPCSSLAYWGNKEEKEYEKIITFYKSKEDYKKKVITKRIDLFKQIFKPEALQAKTIICYGKSHWNEFESFFKGLGVAFQRSSKSDLYKIGILNDRTKVYLIPFLGNGRVSYSSLDRIVKDIKCINH